MLGLDFGNLGHLIDTQVLLLSSVAQLFGNCRHRARELKHLGGLGNALFDLQFFGGL
jgi:hypothetical protein